MLLLMVLLFALLLVSGAPVYLFMFLPALVVIFLSLPEPMTVANISLNSVQNFTLIRNHIKDWVDEIEVDVLGNLMARINPGRDFVMMLDAHMDETGIMVSYVEESGFLRFAPIGGWDPRVFPAQQVEMRSRGDKRYRGVIGASPPHIQTPEEQKQALKVEDLFVDIDANFVGNGRDM